MANENRNYWGYRIDTNRINFFKNELDKGYLRQGWGYDERQNLRHLKMDEGAKRNLTMFNKVKKGDILLVPRLPGWGEVALVEATEDWFTGYQFEIDQGYKDYGHKFPAKYIKKFTRYNQHVTGNLRSTLRNPSRFWSINHYGDDIEKLLRVEKSGLIEGQDHKSRAETAVGEVFNQVFNQGDFKNRIYDKFNEQFSREDWEYALVDGLRELFPYYQIDRVAGKKEKLHGTDILIKIPGIQSNMQYAIAIQVKDYIEYVGSHVIDQINKADEYWGDENLKLIDKIVIITKAEKGKNIHLDKNQDNVNVIFAGDLKELLYEIAKKMIVME